MVPPTDVNFYYFNGVHSVVIEGNPAGTIVCTDSTMFSPATTPPGAILGTAAFFQADSVSCQGCENIRNNACQGPVVPALNG
jgi:hypothetical protein